MQDTPQPTHQQREEFRQFLSEIIATLRDVQPFINDFQADNFTDEQAGIYIDPKLTHAHGRLKSTLAMLDELRGDASREWLTAYLERNRAKIQRRRYILFLSPDGSGRILELGQKEVLVAFGNYTKLSRAGFRAEVCEQNSEHSADIIHFFDHCGLQGVQLSI